MLILDGLVVRRIDRASTDEKSRHLIDVSGGRSAAPHGWGARRASGRAHTKSVIIGEVYCVWVEFAVVLL